MNMTCFSLSSSFPLQYVLSFSSDSLSSYLSSLPTNAWSPSSRRVFYILVWRMGGRDCWSPENVERFFFFLPEPVGLKEGCEYLCECHQVDGTVPELGWDAGWLRAHNTQPSAWHKSVTATETYPHAHKGAQCPVMRMHSHTHARRFSHLPHLARLVKTCRHPHQYARGRSRLRRSLEQLHNRT